ncbi:hypothetical protein RirG_179030 [Rhizophagus irregularis DAOM 197198w]|uniref:Uncharacterized protein n=1 Tax=Rhizophagus irregularis (strain DAOM 197198w) TaxID=1432141 RepID=A0A015JZM5_RHIIW|nr:hypothetical protein RirG_179030 [Rhizophagus irregularis DAOM 197198w]
MSLKPYLLNEVKAGSRPYVVFKQVYHMPKRTKDWDSVDREMAAKRDGYHPTAVLRRTKNWIHRVKNVTNPRNRYFLYHPIYEKTFDYIIIILTTLT